MRRTAPIICIISACITLSACRFAMPYADTSTLPTTMATVSTTTAQTAATTTTTMVTSTTSTTKRVTTKRVTTKRATSKRATTAAKPPVIHVTAGNGAKLSVEYVNQNGFPTGCESASATMLLRFWNIKMTLPTFVDRYLDTGKISYTSGGNMTAPHPNEKFVGNPRSQYAYGCYAPVIVRAISKCLPHTLKVVNETGTSLPDLCKRYLDAGMPVMVWGTINMAPVRKGSSWTVQSTGKTFTWPAGEHCLLLVGYDSTHYYLLDPYQNKGLVKHPRATVEARYAELGRQAVGIQTIPTTVSTIMTTISTTASTAAVSSTVSSVTTPITQPSTAPSSAAPSSAASSQPSESVSPSLPTQSSQTSHTDPQPTDSTE